jgi:hypothetical protein
MLPVEELKLLPDGPATQGEVTARVAENYAICHVNAANLTVLQNWIKGL